MRCLPLALLAFLPGLLLAQQTEGDEVRKATPPVDRARQPAGEVVTQDDDLPLWTRPERAAARLVLVPVTVTTSGREPILDLDITDFQLRLDRTPYPIATFDRPFLDAAGGTPGEGLSADETQTPDGSTASERNTRTPDTGDPAGGTSRVPPRLGKQPPVHIAMVLDLYMSGPGSINSGLHAVKTVLEGELPASSRVGLFVVSHGRMQGITPFTSDTGLLLRDLEEVRTNKLLRDTWITDEATRQEEVAASIGPSVEAVVRSYSIEQSRRVQHVLDSLEALAAAMARLPGRKDVVFVSDGIREQAGLNYVGGILVRESQTSGLGITALAAKTVSLRDEFAYATRVFKEAGVTLSPVSMVGLYSPARLDPNALGELMGSLQFLAKATGGRRPAPLNDFVGEVEAAVDNSSATYILGFRPPPADLPGTVHKIQVRVFRPRTTVSARSEYVDGFDGFDHGTLLAGAALMPDQFNALRLQARARSFPGPDELTEILVQTELSTRALGWLPGKTGRRLGGLAVTGVLRAPNGERTELFRSEYPLDLETAQPPERIVLQERADVIPTPGSDIVVAAVDRISGSVGSVITALPLLPTVGEATRVSAPSLLVPVQGVYLLAPGGKPLIGFHGEGSLFIPAPRSSLEPGPAVALSRIDGLPEDATVRFCVELDGESCVTAGLRPYVRPPASAGLAGAGASATGSPVADADTGPETTNDGNNVIGSATSAAMAAASGPEGHEGAAGTRAAADPSPAPGDYGAWTAWVALDAEVARHADAIRVEVLDAEGALLQLSRK